MHVVVREVVGQDRRRRRAHPQVDEHVHSAAGEVDLRGRRVLVAFNTSAEAVTRNVEIDYRATGVDAMLGECPATVAAPGAVTVTIPAFGYMACELTGGEG